MERQREPGRERRERERASERACGLHSLVMPLWLLTGGTLSHHDGPFTDLTLVQLHDSHRALTSNMNEDAALSVRPSLGVAPCVRVIPTRQCVFCLINTRLHRRNFIICMWLLHVLSCVQPARAHACVRARVRGGQRQRPGTIMPQSTASGCDPR